jgi:hypothetical protein
MASMNYFDSNRKKIKQFYLSGNHWSYTVKPVLRVTLGQRKSGLIRLLKDVQLIQNFYERTIKR